MFLNQLLILKKKKQNKKTQKPKISPRTAELLTNQMKQRAKQCIFHVNVNVLFLCELLIKLCQSYPCVHWNIDFMCLFCLHHTHKHTHTHTHSVSAFVTCSVTPLDIFKENWGQILGYFFLQEVGPSPAVFVVTKLGVYKETSRHFTLCLCKPKPVFFLTTAKRFSCLNLMKR